MKRGKNMIVLLLVLVVCVVAYVVISVHNQKQEEKKISGDVLVSVRAEDINSFTIDTTTIVKKNNIWSYIDDEDAPLSQTLVDAYLKELSSLGTMRSFKDTEADTTMDMGFATAQTIIFADMQGIQTKLELGAENEFSAQRYLRLNGDNSVFYMVSAESVALFSKTILDFIEKESMPDVSDATQIVITNESGTYTWNNMGVGAETGQNHWVRDADIDVDTAQVDAFLLQATNLVWDDMATYNASVYDMETYGLETPSATVTITTPMETVSLHIGAPCDDLYYAHISESPMVYKLGTFAESLLSINANYFDGTIE